MWNEAENREREWGVASQALWACEARALHARKTLTPRVTDFFTDFEKHYRLFCSLTLLSKGYWPEARGINHITPRFRPVTLT